MSGRAVVEDAGAMRRLLGRLRQRIGMGNGVTGDAKWSSDPGLPPRRHEHEIRALFPGRVDFTGDGPVLDKPLLVLAFTNRSGSNLLADYLLQTGRVAGLGEYLNHDTVGHQKQALRIESMPDYLPALARKLSRKGQQFGVKASAEQLDFLIRWRLPRLFSRTTVVHIHRDDVIGQAVSHWIAVQTGQWTSQQDRRPVEVAFDPDALRTIANDVLRSDAAIRLHCGMHRLPYVSVSYEELTADPAATLGRIARVAGFDLGGWIPREPEIARQATDLNDELKARLTREL